MAKCMAICRGHDSSRVKEDHRLGSVRAEAEANTWRTFATVATLADGSVSVRVTRDGVVLHHWTCGPEAPKAVHGPGCALRNAPKLTTCRCDSNTLFPMEA